MMPEIEVVYVDENLMVINKPPGISVHGGPSVLGPTVADFLLKRFPEIQGVGDEPFFRPGIVHRLDKDTSGIMVVARNQKSFERLKYLFSHREVEKTYHAILCGTPKETSGVISYSIGRLVRNPVKRGVRRGDGTNIKGEREAATEYRVLRSGQKYSLVEFRPKTGRMHQIRVHAAAIGHPVACDTTYGGKNVCCPEGARRQLLHAQSLAFQFIPGTMLRFDADPPENFSSASESIS